MAGETVLVLSGQGMPPYAVRGATQTLEIIEAAKNMRRTVNAELVSLSPLQFDKYKSTISCADQQSPAFDALKIGTVLTVSCIAELCYLTSGGSPARPVVVGSSWVEGSYTLYRPQLVMMVTSKSQSTDEAGAVVSWSLELEEV